MNEPLTTSRPGISFSGKTYNNHPQWYNQPLRLNDEQRRNPLEIFEEFFENYHLNDTREILWYWLTEVLSSSRLIPKGQHHQGNQMYFYEKMEELIEAAYVMRRKIHKHRRKQEKRRLKRRHQPEKGQATGITERINEDIPGIGAESANVETIFNKPKELIEYVSENPNYVIAEVFKSYDLKRHESLACIRDQLQDWLFVAISADTAVYEEGEQRKHLMVFVEQLLVLIEALFVINIKNIGKEEEQDKEADKPRLLNQEQLANPLKVVITFFENFPMIYCIRELNDWLEAGIAYSGVYPENMDRFLVLYTYRHVLCLIKSANRLLKQ
jgi:hypothetical protein